VRISVSSGSQYSAIRATPARQEGVGGSGMRCTLPAGAECTMYSRLSGGVRAHVRISPEHQAYALHNAWPSSVYCSSSTT
jgi:hypothetical protein